MAKINTSKIFNEIVTPFRWYDNPYKRNKYKEYCKGYCDYKLYTNNASLLPFMIVRPHSTSPLTSWNLISNNGGSVTALPFADIVVTQVGNKDYIVYYGTLVGFTMDCGYYFSELTDGTNTWYSEEFFVTESGFCQDILSVPDSFLDGLTMSGTPINFCSGGGISGAAIYILAAHINETVVVRFKVTGHVATGDDGFVFGVGSGNVGTLDHDGTYSYVANTGDTGFGFGAIVIGGDSDWIGCVSDVQILLYEENFTECNIGLTWRSDCDFGNQLTSSGFINKFLFAPDVQIGEPSYRLVREYISNGVGNNIERFRKRQKVYKIETGLVPEFVVDALVDMQLYPNKNLYLPNCLGNEVITDVTVSPTWEFDDKCFANVKIEFIIDEIVEKGCCDGLAEGECLQPCHEISGIVDGGVPLEEGLYYIVGGTSPDIVQIVNGVPVVVDCDSGFVLDISGIFGNNYLSFDLDTSSWRSVPRLISIEPVNAELQTFRVKWKLIPNTIGQLYMNDASELENCSDATYTSTGVEMTADDWENVGAVVTIEHGGFCWANCMKMFIQNCGGGESRSQHSCCKATEFFAYDGSAGSRFDPADYFDQIEFADSSTVSLGGIPLSDIAGIIIALNGLALIGYTNWSVSKYIDADDVERIRVSVCNNAEHDESDASTRISNMRIYQNNIPNFNDSGFAPCQDCFHP